MSEIPSRQTACWIVNPGKDWKLDIRHDVEVKRPGPGEVLVRMECTGLCHSDCRNVLGMGEYTEIPGHEGVGKVVTVGLNVNEDLIGKRVGIKWLWTACRNCSSCSQGRANNCSKQGNTGRTCWGTLQQYAVADAAFVTHIPDGIASEVAAPLLCAGLSLAGAVSLVAPEVQPGQWVAIIGAGGGLGHIGVQIAARAKGYKVIAVDGGDDKKELCLRLGASEFVDYKKDNVVEKVKSMTDGEGAHAVIIVAGSERAYEQAPDLVRNCGVLVCVGLPRGDYHLPLSPIQIANRGLVIKGSSTGTEAQMSELLQWNMDGLVEPRIEVHEFGEAPAIIDKLTKDEVTGRMVVTIP
ncbi:alcohol dehydrogenase [Pseudovirgaria hyperparasitica]|uniref:Alcohol dehydrogenase n=1 Tax=Pseudovirgaria hyperparasitica TaxID=470096 RepID=A0A6A6W938_9PEZI|nr:alcohol dehydrogenase [Pseudovirgaria hyperparasitica]KAF2758406.1 alcohol dehydrogenase [Pseudovirgaria hyperparasitica]